jgi:hypothetical protein
MHWAFYTSWQLPHRRQGPRRRPLEDPPPVAGPSSSALACRRVTMRFAVDTSPEVARERFGVDLTSFSASIPSFLRYALLYTLLACPTRGG